jgi:hypothetical protein
MKKLKYIFLFASSSLLILTSIQAQEQVMASAREAIKSGDIPKLVSQLNEPIELNLINQKNNFNKAQAEIILKDFFDKNPAKSFEYDHQTTSRGGLRFTIGTYISQNGHYRVHMLIKETDGKYRIDMIDIVKN